jgi:hypothetical protein
MAQKLAHELRAAQQRISELEAEVGAYQNQAERAEQWLHKVYTEIEDRFLQQGRSLAVKDQPANNGTDLLQQSFSLHRFLHHAIPK